MLTKWSVHPKRQGEQAIGRRWLVPHPFVHVLVRLSPIDGGSFLVIALIASICWAMFRLLKASEDKPSRLVSAIEAATVEQRYFGVSCLVS